MSLAALACTQQPAQDCAYKGGKAVRNLDIVTVALNMYTQGVDPKLDFHDILSVAKVYEECTKMTIPPRQPYAGKLAFTAFSREQILLQLFCIVCFSLFYFVFENLKVGIVCFSGVSRKV